MTAAPEGIFHRENSVSGPIPNPEGCTLWAVRWNFPGEKYRGQAGRSRGLRGGKRLRSECSPTRFSPRMALCSGCPPGTAGTLLLMESPPRRPPYVPSREEFSAGMQAYERNEPRGRDYFLALRQLTAGWGEPGAMADAVWVLLKSWHREFYRFGRLELSELAGCVETHLPDLNRVRGRIIDSLCADDEQIIEKLYGPFTTATRRHNQRGFQESAVATAKALHLLAPGFLPLWAHPYRRRT